MGMGDSGGDGIWAQGWESTWVPSRAVQALPRGAAHGPVPIHEETVAHRVAEPLHGKRHRATLCQAGLAGATQEEALWGKGAGLSHWTPAGAQSQTLEPTP